MSSCKVGFSSWDAVVLAGGRSVRMGRDKATLRVEGVPLLELQLGRVGEAGARQRWVSLGADGGPPGMGWEGVGVLRDPMPGLGPWPGMLAAMRASRADALLVLAVDLPALTTGFLRRLAGEGKPGVGCIPRSPEGFEPLCAIYPLPVALRVAESPWEPGEPSPRRLALRGLEEGWMQALTLDARESAGLVNWNRPADWPHPPG